MILDQANPQLQEIIWKAVNEDPNTRNRDLDIIKNWLKQQPHLPDYYDEIRLLNFLRGCSFHIEKCKRKIDMYFTMRAALPEFFNNRDMNRPEIYGLTEIAEAAVLPGLTKEGYRVSVARGRASDSQIPDLTSFFKTGLMMGDIRLAIEEIGIAGEVFICDASMAKLVYHVFKQSPVMVKKFIICAREAYPVKVKQIHIVNVSPFVQFFINFISPLLREKIRKRIYTHKNFDCLHEYVPKEILPEEFGGTTGKLADIQNEWVQLMRDYAPWFAAEEKIKADESKRPGQATNYDDLFGVDGTFKQLNID